MFNFQSILVLALLISCSRSSNTSTTPCSNVSAIISDTSKVSRLPENIGFGLVTFKLDEQLAGSVFSGQDERLSEIESSDKLGCKLFFIQDNDGMDIWTSRHCFFRLAMTNFKFQIFADGRLDPNEIKVEGMNEDDWSTIRSLVKAMDSEVFKDSKEDSFAKRFLFQNFNNYDAYSWIRKKTTSWRSGLLEGVSIEPIIEDSFYTHLFKTFNDEQTYAGRDLCSTAYNMEAKSGKYQEICFTPGDMIVLRTKEKRLGENSPVANSADYNSWKNTIQKLDDSTLNYMIDETLFWGQRHCIKNSGAEGCAIDNELDSIAEEADSLKGTNGRHQSKLANFRSAGSNSALLGLAEGHRTKLLDSYTALGSNWDELSKRLLTKSDKMELYGVFRNPNDRVQIGGGISLAGLLSSGTSTLSRTPYGLYMEFDNSALEFEVSDSGSMLFVEGFPLANLSTVNGLSSSGGIASTGDITVDFVPTDILPPENNINVATANPISDQSTSSNETSENNTSQTIENITIQPNPETNPTSREQASESSSTTDSRSSEQNSSPSNTSQTKNSEVEQERNSGTAALDKQPDC